MYENKSGVKKNPQVFFSEKEENMNEIAEH